MSWYAKGNDAQKFKEQAATAGGNVWRFRLKAGERRRILFLEDEGFAVQEGVVKLGGNSFETYTCSQDQNSYFLRNRLPTMFTQYYTVLDLTPYKAKDGTEKKYSRRAFGVRGVAIETLNRRKTEKGGLTGWVVECIRDSDKSPSVGNDFVMIEKVDLTKFPPLDIKPMDWMKVLAPVKAEIIEARLRGGSSHGEPETFSRGEDAPF